MLVNRLHAPSSNAKKPRRNAGLLRCHFCVSWSIGALSCVARVGRFPTSVRCRPCGTSQPLRGHSSVWRRPFDVSPALYNQVHDNESDQGERIGCPAALGARGGALHSSSALGVNVFSYWESRADLRPLLSAIDLPGDTGVLEFERKLPTGAGGTPPNLDVVITLADGTLVGIESKFTEWMTPKPGLGARLAPYVSDDGSSYWSRAGLPSADCIAKALYDGREKYEYLDVQQLFKHALGLARQAAGAPWSLRYVYLGAPGAAGNDHAEEIARFSAAVGEELRFSAITYQSLFASLAGAPTVDATYLAYLRDRYASP